MQDEQFIWVFCGEGSHLPAALFTDEGLAETWIKAHMLSGILTAYPINKSVYDWAIENRYFRPAAAHQQNPRFIGTFTCASLRHYHYESGQKVG
jgi:hypothetical protein